MWSLEKHCRISIEIVEVVVILVKEIGADKIRVRMSPFANYMESKDSNFEGTRPIIWPNPLANVVAKL